MAADARTMAILVMRSDAFPLVQNEPTLAALPKDTFTLDMMLEGSYHSVIEGPARLLDPPLKIDPQPVPTRCSRTTFRGRTPCRCSRFTLRDLYDNTPDRQRLAGALAGYDKIGRVKGCVIAQTVEQAYAEAVAEGRGAERQRGAPQARAFRPSFRISPRSTWPASSCAACRRATGCSSEGAAARRPASPSSAC